MKIKTSELSGDALDYFVGRMHKRFDDPKCTVPYSTEWEDGGPIIEQEKLGVWWATHYVDDDGQEYGNHWYAETAEGLVGYGPTPLIAAMRCYVASKLGEEVEVPDELTP